MNEIFIDSKVSLKDLYKTPTINSKENYSLNDEENKKMLDKENELKKMFHELSNDEIVSKLIESKPSEQGGVIGISGYYFQMLVTIHYMIEMLKDNWTFIAMEYHDDIVVCNEVTNIVRFIQVKSSNENIKRVSQTDVYTRTNSRNISWIDKLFENSRVFNGVEINKQFELFCDYFICNTSGHGKVEIEHYFRENDGSYNWEIDDEDDLFKRLKEVSYDSKGNKIVYETQYGSSLKDMLSKLKFTYISKSLFFADSVQKGLADLINSRLMDGEIGVSQSNLNWLVGELISRCAKGNEKWFLFIEKAVAETLIYELQIKCVEESRRASQSHDNHILLKSGIDALLEELKSEEASASFCNEIEKALLEYRELLLATLDKDNTIENMINRFLKGRKIVVARGYDIQPYVNEFIKSSFVLFLLFEVFNISGEFERLLTHSSRKLDVNSWIIFFHAGMKSSKKAIRHLNEIVSETANLEEALRLIINKTPLYMILHGSNVDITPLNFELSTEKRIEHEKFNEEHRLTKVTKLTKLLPVNNINAAYVDVDEFNSIEDFVNVINDIWSNLITGGVSG